MIRVLLVEDQGVVLGALRALLSLEADLRVTGAAGDAATALHLLEQEQPDLLVTDVEMPGQSGLELTATVRERYPQVKVVLLTTFARPGYLRRALALGVRGYLLKAMPAPELVEALRRVHAGILTIDPDLREETEDATESLTSRERQVLHLVEEGVSTAEMAVRLGLSEGTVRNYLSEAMSKLGVASRFEAARKARHQGWL